tara:strand:+ start:555 stop:2417 length:1863 start_codon:yes stop_codon:yes gene_type:complete
MAVLNRKLFNRGGPVSSRGVGITSGLVPVQKFQEGGEVSKLEALSPFLLDLSGRLLGNTSLTGSFGEIAGKSLSGAAPSLAEGLKTYRAGQKVDDDRQIMPDAQGYQRYVDTGERVFPGVEKPVEEEKPQYTKLKPGESLYKDGELVTERVMLEKNQQLIKLNPNQILIDPVTKEEVARGIEKADTEVYKLNPGQKIFNKNNEVIAFYEPPAEQEDVIKLNPGQKAFDRQGNLLFEAPATVQEGKVFKLSPGQKAFDSNGKEIASVAPNEPKPIDTTVTVAPGSKIIDKETGEVIFENPTATAQQKLYKAQPGTTLIDGSGNIIYEAPEQKQYFKLKPGERIYDEGGNVIATGTTALDNMDKYNEFKTESERYNFVVRTLEKKAGYDANGNVILGNLDFAEQSEYKLALEQVSTSYRRDLENWGDTQKEFLETISNVYNMEEQLRQVEDLLVNPSDELIATGPITGRITPFFGVLENLTGLNMATVINDVLGKEVLLENLPADEINRLQKTIALQFQEKMKGQVSNYEARQIVASMFNVTKLPGSNELALDNMRFINDMNKAMISISQNVDTYDEFAQRVQAWKKDNKPPVLKTPNEGKQDINDKYGFKIFNDDTNKVKP